MLEPKRPLSGCKKRACASEGCRVTATSIRGRILKAQGITTSEREKYGNSDFDPREDTERKEKAMLRLWEIL
jgi:hypothetical protein